MNNPERYSAQRFPLSEQQILAHELYDHVVVEGHLDAVSLLQAKDIRNLCAKGRLNLIIKTNLHKEAFRSIVLNKSKGTPLYSIADLVNIVSEVNSTYGEDDPVRRQVKRQSAFKWFKYGDAAKETYALQEWMREELNDPSCTFKDLIMSLPMKTGDDIQNVIGLGVLLQSKIPSKS